MNGNMHVTSGLTVSVKTEGLPKVTGSHEHHTCGSISETVQDRRCYYRALIGSDDLLIIGNSLNDYLWTFSSGTFCTFVQQSMRYQPPKHVSWSLWDSWVSNGCFLGELGYVVHPWSISSTYSRRESVGNKWYRRPSCQSTIKGSKQCIEGTKNYPHETRENYPLLSFIITLFTTGLRRKG